MASPTRRSSTGHSGVPPPPKHTSATLAQTAIQNDNGPGRSIRVVLIGAALGAFAFSQCLPFSLVNPTSVLWLFSWGIDPSANFASWHMFRSEPWTWPPGAVHSFGHPVGTSVALTDSVPLIAIGLKALGPLLPDTFQFFGIWLLSCFVLQGVFGALLMTTITNRVRLQVPGAALFVMSPVLIHRIGHNALCAQWLVLAALWLHRTQPARRGWAWAAVAWAGLCTLAAGTHAYLALMVLAVAGATVLAGPFCPGQRRVAVALALTLLPLTWLVWWLCGFFIVDASRDLQLSGFGILSMNVASPLIPSPGALLDGRLPFTVARPDQDDGFAYLGLGVLFLAATAAPALFVRRPLRPTPWTVALGAVCLALTLFAFSPTIMVNQSTVIEYDPRWWGPLSVFRASGRMFWPVYYAIVLGLIGAIINRLQVRWAAGLLVAAVVLQAADVSGAFRLIRDRQPPVSPDPLASRFWDVVLPHYRHVVLNPTNMCVPAGQGIDYRYFALRAGRARATLNAGHAARYDADKVARYCQSLAEDLRAGRVSDDTVYVMHAGLAAAFTKAAQQQVTCTSVDTFDVCFTASSHGSWRHQFEIISQGLPRAGCGHGWFAHEIRRVGQVAAVVAVAQTVNPSTSVQDREALARSYGTWAARTRYTVSSA